MSHRRFRMATVCASVAVIVINSSQSTQAATDNAALRWNAAALQAIRRSTLGPPAVARALAILHTCIYDAWAVYDPVALGVHYREKDLSAPALERQSRAISYAAYRALVNLFPTEHSLFDQVMAELGYDPKDVADIDSALGATAAQAGLDHRAEDGANQAGNYADYTDYAPVNTADAVLDPNRWQPLRLPDGTVQRFLAPHWGLVEPFALASADQFRPRPPAQDPHGLYRKQALEILQLSARLGDREKVIASYWADGPRTETPPGHWCLFAHFVSHRDQHALERDVKLFFALSTALMDASIAAWDAKRFYDSVRPVTAIRTLFAGQPVRAWAGPNQGTQLITGDMWRSYIPTPPFAEYVSGHSTFSAASAEILRRFTGSDRLEAQVIISAGSSSIEPGVVPARDLMLAWATFSEAADEAGLSRRYGGIHFADGDLEGRAMGRRIGAVVWQKVQAYFTGTAGLP
jgi:PAP2 superfamily